MSIKTTYILKALYVLSWIIFAGLGVEAGGFITQFIATLALTPEGATRFWKEIDLAAVYHYDQSRYVMLASIILVTFLLKVLLFYCIIRIFHTKELNLSRPFNEPIRRFIVTTAYLALGIGLFSAWGIQFATRLAEKGVALPGILSLRIGGADVWLFMGITLLVIGFIFKKGVEIQTENELTV